MARKGKDSLTKSINQDVKSIKKHQRELLKRANKSVREYRHELSILKKVGIASAKIDARKHTPTKYMLSRIRKFSDVVRGEVNVVRAPKAVREKYTSKGLLEERGSFLIVPKDSNNQKARLRKGMIAKYKPLRNGEERKIILPYKATDLEQLAQRIRDNADDIDKMKEPTEQFGFQLYGHNSLIGEPDADHLASYILRNYSHMFKKKDSLKEFVLIRFKNRFGRPLSEPFSGERKYSVRQPLDPRNPRDRMILENRKEKRAKRKAAQRARETAEQREKRLSKQRIYQRQYLQKKFEEE
jgi:hypothetical protein